MGGFRSQRPARLATLKGCDIRNNLAVDDYIYISIPYFPVCVYLGSKLLLKQVLLKTMQHSLFIIFYRNFSSLLVIFLVLGSRWWSNCAIYSAQVLSTIHLVIISGHVVLSCHFEIYLLQQFEVFSLEDVSWNVFSNFF